MSLTLEDSTTYQWILQKGIARGEARIILRQGTKKFGPPDEATAARLAALTDPDRLDRIADRVFDAASWDDLLSTP